MLKKISLFVCFVFSCFLLNILFVKNTYAQNNSSFLISNKSDTDKALNLKGNVGFFSDINDLIAFINKRYDSNIFLLDYQKAWRFMVDYTWVAKYPLTYEDWYHNPLTFINSTGWGFCDDKSIVLSKIWAAMGYKSRVCYMNRHIVPEIFTNNRWEMWDPTFQVFYIDSLHTVLGVEDLIKNNTPALTPHYDKRIKTSIWLTHMGFKKEFALLYKQSENFRFKNTVYQEEKDNVQFLLPKNAQIVFPIYEHFPLKTTTYTFETRNQNNYAQLMLRIPPMWTGQIKYPIVLHAMVSSGAEVLVDNKKIILNKRNKAFVVENFAEKNSIEVITNEKGIRIFYLINPKLFETKENFENIKTYLNSEKIELQIIKLPLNKRPNILNLDEINTDDAKSYFITARYFLRKMFF